MKKAELLQKLTELENKLNALGDIQTKAGEAESLLQRIRDLASQIDQDKQQSSQFKTEIQAISEEMKNLKQPVDEALTVANEYKATINKQSQDVEGIKKQGSSLIKNVKDLEVLIKNQLGLVNATVLSNSFQKQADQLKGSVERWFKWVKIMTLVLFVLAFGIVAWQLLTFNTLWNVNFLIKLTLTSPVIFILIFVTKQYSREKRLLDEYSFKAAVALSFEAYRKLIKEEGTEGVDKNKIVEFIISSVNNIYTSPMENMHKHREIGEEEIDIFGKIAEVFKKFIK